MSSARAIAGVVTALYLSAEGFSGLQIGELFAVVALATALMSSAIGLLSDRFRRKPFLIYVPLLAALAGVGFATIRTPGLLVVLAAAGGFGRGAGAGGGNVGPYQPAESALVAESVPARARTEAFGRLAFCSALGALAGGLLAGLAQPGSATGAAATAAYRPAFLAAAILAALAGVITVWLREKVRADGAPKRRINFPRRSWPVLWRFWATNSVNGLAIGMIGPFFSYWLHRRYGASPAVIGQLFAVVNATSLISTLVAARVARRLGTVRTIVAMRIVGGLLLIPMALAPTFWIAGGIYTIRMLGQRVGMPLRQSFVQGVADADERASVAALSNLPAQGTQAGGQVVAGYMFDEVGLAIPFEVGALLQLVNAALYAVLFGRASLAEEGELMTEALPIRRDPPP